MARKRRRNFKGGPVAFKVVDLKLRRFPALSAFTRGLLEHADVEGLHAVRKEAPILAGADLVRGLPGCAIRRRGPHRRH